MRTRKMANVLHDYRDTIGRGNRNAARRRRNLKRAINRVRRTNDRIAILAGT